MKSAEAIRISMYRSNGSPAGHRTLEPVPGKLACRVGEGYAYLEIAGIPMPRGGRLEIEAV